MAHSLLVPAQRVLRLLAKVSQCSSVFMLGCMVLVTFMQVIFRYLLNNSLDWSEEAARYLFVWVCYISMSYAMSTGSHLEVTVLRGRFGPQTDKMLNLFSLFVTTVFSGIVCWFGIDAVEKLYLTEQTTVALQIHTYLVWMCLPLGFGLTAIQSFLRALLILGNVPTPEMEEAGGVMHI